MFFLSVSDHASAPSLPQDAAFALPTLATILLAEDEDAIRRVAERILSRAGYNVLAARNGVEALYVASTFADRIHVLVSDVLMPVVGGEELATQLLVQRPDLRVLLPSGDLEETVMGDAPPPNRFFLQKPFTGDELLRKIREILAS